MSDKSARDTVQDAYNEESGIKREGNHVTPSNPKQWKGVNKYSDDNSLHSGQKPLREAEAEAEIVSQLQTVFRSHKIVTQYAVAGNGKAYYVDLVFPGANLAVEIDEHGHESYDEEEEQEREYAVQKEGFTLLRHNPHEAPVIELIADIHEHLHPDL